MGGGCLLLAILLVAWLQQESELHFSDGCNGACMNRLGRKDATKKLSTSNFIAMQPALSPEVVIMKNVSRH